jgi:hypothetical protein
MGAHPGGGSCAEHYTRSTGVRVGLAKQLDLVPDVRITTPIQKINAVLMLLVLIVDRTIAPS